MQRKLLLKIEAELTKHYLSSRNWIDETTIW